MITPREVATILAALLFWQEEILPHDSLVMRPYFETLGLGSYDPLLAAELEDLSTRLRTTFLANP